MAAATEIDETQEAIDKALASLGVRELIPYAEVQDMLLDIRTAHTRSTNR